MFDMRKPSAGALSTLFKNVPFLTSFKMSPVLVAPCCPLPCGTSCSHAAGRCAPRPAPRVARRRFPPRSMRRPLLPHPDRSGRLRLRRLDLPVRPRLALIPNLDPLVFPFAHRHLRLPRRIIAASLQLKVPVPIAHHPIVGNAALRLQTKHLLQFPRTRRLAVVILGLRRFPHKTARCDRPDTVPAKNSWLPHACGSSCAPSS